MLMGPMPTLGLFVAEVLLAIFLLVEALVLAVVSGRIAARTGRMRASMVPVAIGVLPPALVLMGVFAYSQSTIVYLDTSAQTAACDTAASAMSATTVLSLLGAIAWFATRPRAPQPRDESSE